LGRAFTSPAQRTRSFCRRKVSALCGGRYASNLNYTRLGSEPPQPRGRARRWTANGQARSSTRLLRRPTVRLSSRRSPMPQRVPPSCVGAWGAAGCGDVSTPIDRSAARRARLGLRSALNRSETRAFYLERVCTHFISALYMCAAVSWPAGTRIVESLLAATSVNSVTSAGQFTRIGATTMPMPRFVYSQV
jgi:hypothetical protein